MDGITAEILKYGGDAVVDEEGQEEEEEEEEKEEGDEGEEEGLHG